MAKSLVVNNSIKGYKGRRAMRFTIRRLSEELLKKAARFIAAGKRTCGQILQSRHLCGKVHKQR